MIDQNLQTILQSILRYTKYQYTRYTDIHIVMLRIQPGKDETYIESHCKESNAGNWKVKVGVHTTDTTETVLEKMITQ